MFCKNCGKKINDGVKFCKYCGHKIATHIQTTSTSKKVYGAFLPRAGAYIIDQSLILIGLILILIFIGSWDEGWDASIGLVSLVIYNTFFLYTRSTTPGKMLYGLKVVDERTNSKLNFAKSFGRSLSYFISSIALGFGFWQIAFDKRKHQGWHDHLAGTVVLQKRYNKQQAFIVTIIAAIFYIFFAVYGYTAEEEVWPYPIRSGTREIHNQLLINSELFNEGDNLRSVNNKSSLDYSGLSNSDFNIKNQLAPIVVIACPIDDSRDEWNIGSGVIINDEGIIFTNYHVIQDTAQYYCEIGITNDLSRDPEYIYYADYKFLDDISGDAIFVANEEIDVALLQIVGAMEGYQLPLKFPAISAIGSSDALNINDKIFIAGYPSFGGGTITFTEGVMSGRVGDDLIKTSAKIDSGNSGGGAFNEQGELIGIPTLISIGTAEGLGYIVGIDSLLYWIEQIFSN